MLIEMEAISTQLNAFAIQNSKLLAREIIETLNFAKTARLVPVGRAPSFALTA